MEDATKDVPVAENPDSPAFPNDVEDGGRAFRAPECHDLSSVAIVHGSEAEGLSDFVPIADALLGRDHVVVEGDILVQRSDLNAPNEDRGLKAFNYAREDGPEYWKSRLWEKGIIPYEIDPKLPPEMLGHFYDAAFEWQQKTGLQWVPRTDEKNYVRIAHVTVYDDG